MMTIHLTGSAPASEANLGIGRECDCGCDAWVSIDGFGTAISDSVDGIKVFFASEQCRQHWREQRAQLLETQ